MNFQINLWQTNKRETSRQVALLNYHVLQTSKLQTGKHLHVQVNIPKLNICTPNNICDHQGLIEVDALLGLELKSWHMLTLLSFQVVHYNCQSNIQRAAPGKVSVPSRP